MFSVIPISIGMRNVEQSKDIKVEQVLKGNGEEYALGLDIAVASPSLKEAPIDRVAEWSQDRKHFVGEEERRTYLEFVEKDNVALALSSRQVIIERRATRIVDIRSLRAHDISFTSHFCTINMQKWTFE